MSDELVKAGRLALRHEGGSWVAYYALPDTMQGALILGSIAMGSVINRPERKEQFMALMREVVSDFIEEATGERPRWPDPPSPAPEHERAGNG
jgi:hypothetical protein